MSFSLSIVSHRSGPLISLLLNDLRTRLPTDSEIILTINTPEDESFLATYGDLPIQVLRNDVEQGFGANHNQAFDVARCSYFIVVNPDIRLLEAPFDALAHAIDMPGVGACAPVVLAPDGKVEDSVRRFPTLTRLLRRVILRQRQPDYDPLGQTAPMIIDWAAGMFVVFSRSAYMAVGGFDTRYYMYLEDADICKRLWAHGSRVVLVPQARVVHDAQRTSRRSWRHFRWHLRSAIRFLFGV
jgi:N-acetylglucosaminyl-diphospho-decaprenol L-rhamnosyltransferase